MIDSFIKEFNLLPNETFDQNRKLETGKLIIERMQILVKVKDSGQQEIKGFTGFKIIKTNKTEIIIKEAINEILGDKDGLVTNDDLSKIAKLVINKAKEQSFRLPTDLKNQKNIEEFLQNIAPLKKYHEGDVLEKIRKLIGTISKLEGFKKSALKEIGQNCAKLFDYPKVANSEENKIEVLCEAIPRHMIIFFNAFGELRNLDKQDKEVIYDSFLNQILKLQLWENHPIPNAENPEAPLQLDRNLLKKMVLDYCNIDPLSFDFSMKPYLSESKKTPILDKSSKIKQDQSLELPIQNSQTPSSRPIKSKREITDLETSEGLAHKKSKIEDHPEYSNPKLVPKPSPIIKTKNSQLKKLKEDSEREPRTGV